MLLTVFRLYILEDFSVIFFCTFFKRSPMKTTLSDGGLLLKEDFFTLNIINYYYYLRDIIQMEGKYSSIILIKTICLGII